MKQFSFFLLTAIIALSACKREKIEDAGREFNAPYTGAYLNQVSFPLGGIGAGMVCIEGNGKLSRISVRHKADLSNDPFAFAALAVKGLEHGARVLEGPVGSGLGRACKTTGYPRFAEATFKGRFPFGYVALTDPTMPVSVTITAWSPFIPGNADNSSLPVAALEYTFENTTDSALETVFSFHSENFMRIEQRSDFGGKYAKGNSVNKMQNGFILSQACTPENPEFKGDFAVFTREQAVVDYCWFRGGWFDAYTMLWHDIESLTLPADTNTEGSTGASLYVPVNLKAGQKKTVSLMLAWHVPHSDIRHGGLKKPDQAVCDPSTACCSDSYTAMYYEPWYSERFKTIGDISRYWADNVESLRQLSTLFSETFFASDLPPEVLEAVSANLSILKSPTVLRQRDGKLWAYEGCFGQNGGCCNGSCTHVWNYAQAIPHLFPRLERSLRETEFLMSQDTSGHQNFRSALPIGPTDHQFHAAADGQLGGMMKVYREWRISGDTDWLRKLWPQVKKSFAYCSNTWDPLHKGVVEEPHHNTYDVEFWGPEPMCMSFYVGAAKAMSEMSRALGEPADVYESIHTKGKQYLENELFNGEYFFQKVVWEGLKTPNPLEAKTEDWNIEYSPEALELLKKEGPKYQYATGCLSDGVLGCWLGRMCQVPEFLNAEKVKSHLQAVYNYNFKTDLRYHINPQRSGFANGAEGGLLLCTWPRGDKPSLPFTYSNEVWTGIEYQVAGHLIMLGEVEKGLAIVRAARSRYDGRVRNPFDEYECGHFYARALSSYGLLQALTGMYYDAVDKCLYIDSQSGSDFQAFFAWESGFGTGGLKNGKPFLEVRHGHIDIQKCVVSGKMVAWQGSAE